MIAIPDFAAGAMENYGLVTYRETALLYDDQHSAAANKQRVLCLTMKFVFCLGYLGLPNLNFQNYLFYY